MREWLGGCLVTGKGQLITATEAVVTGTRKVQSATKYSGCTLMCYPKITHHRKVNCDERKDAYIFNAFPYPGYLEAKVTLNIRRHRTIACG